MTMGDIAVLLVLGLIVGSIIAGMIQNKKKGKDNPCSGCAYYGTCRAHVGCSNNAKKK